MALDQVCTMVPPLIRKECKSLVQKYSDKLVDSIANGIKLIEVCKHIGLCSKDSWAAEEYNLDFTEEGLDVKCKACKAITKELGHILKGKRTKVSKTIPKLVEIVNLLNYDVSHVHNVPLYDNLDFCKHRKL